MSYNQRRPTGPGSRPSKPTAQAQPKPARALLDTPSAAKMMHMSSRTLEKWRSLGEGPPFLKFGRRVLYSRTDLEGWIESRRRQSTSEV